MVRQGTTWILLADGARSRVLSRKEPQKQLTEIDEGRLSGTRAFARDLKDSPPGRSFDSAGQGRHAMEAPTDPRDQAESEFLRSVIEWLAVREQAGAFDNLIVIAAPRALGELRRLYTRSMRDKLVKEIDADLVQADVRDLEARLEWVG